jgi:hypothetical protein
VDSVHQGDQDGFDAAFLPPRNSRISIPVDMLNTTAYLLSITEVGPRQTAGNRKLNLILYQLVRSHSMRASDPIEDGRPLLDIALGHGRRQVEDAKPVESGVGIDLAVSKIGQNRQVELV